MELDKLPAENCLWRLFKARLGEALSFLPVEDIKHGKASAEEDYERKVE